VPVKKLPERNPQRRQNRPVAALVLTTTLLCASPRMAQTEKPIWAGHSGGFTIKWTSNEITASPPGNPANTVFSAKLNAERDFRVFKKENLDQGTDMQCSYEHTVRLLSVVGSFMSYRLDETAYCGSGEGGPRWARPSTNISYRVTDLNMPTRQIKLTHFYSEGEVLKALMADPLVKKAMQASKSKKPPKTVEELVEMFADEGLAMEPTAATAESPEGCAYTFPNEVLTQFAFHHLENNRVAIRISLEPDSGACSTGHAQLGILLPIPASLKASLESAQAGEEGFLMKDAKSLSGNLETVVRYEVKSPGRKRNQ
jgi:hypothetical protein